MTTDEILTNIADMLIQDHVLFPDWPEDLLGAIVHLDETLSMLYKPLRAVDGKLAIGGSPDAMRNCALLLAARCIRLLQETPALRPDATAEYLAIVDVPKKPPDNAPRGL